MTDSVTPESAAAAIDEKVKALTDWRGATFAQVRKLILAVDPDIFEELKWRGAPVWSLDGILCTGEIYKQVVKMTFAKGASLPDPTGLFNSSLEGNVRRAIDVHENEQINQQALQDLIRAAIALNEQSRAKPKLKKTT